MKNIRSSIKWTGAIIMVLSIALVGHLVWQAGHKQQSATQVQESAQIENEALVYESVVVIEVPKASVPEIASGDPALEERNQILQEMGFNPAVGHRMKFGSSNAVAVSVSEKQTN